MDTSISPDHTQIYLWVNLGWGAYGFAQSIYIVKYNEIHLQCHLCHRGDISFVSFDILPPSTFNR
jgi:hypothetical protein